MLSFVLYLSRTSKPKILVRVPDGRKNNRKFTTDPNLPECPQLKLVRVDGSLFFGAINHVTETLRRFEKNHPEQKNLLLLAQGINFVDSTGAEFLDTEAKYRQKLGGKLFLYGAKQAVCEQLRRAGHMETIGEENLFISKTVALSTIYEKHIDKNLCQGCNKRIFMECKN